MKEVIYFEILHLLDPYINNTTANQLTVVLFGDPYMRTEYGSNVSIHINMLCAW